MKKFLALIWIIKNFNGTVWPWFEYRQQLFKKTFFFSNRLFCINLFSAEKHLQVFMVKDFKQSFAFGGWKMKKLGYPKWKFQENSQNKRIERKHDGFYFHLKSEN